MYTEFKHTFMFRKGSKHSAEWRLDAKGKVLLLSLASPDFGDGIEIGIQHDRGPGGWKYYRDHSTLAITTRTHSAYIPNLKELVDMRYELRYSAAGFRLVAFRRVDTGKQVQMIPFPRDGQIVLKCAIESDDGVISDLDMARMRIEALKSDNWNLRVRLAEVLEELAKLKNTD